MLYDMCELQHAALAPLRFGAETLQSLFSNPFVPVAYTGFGRTVAASCEMVERSTREYAKPAFHIDSTEIDGQSVAVTEDVVLHTDFCNLLHFARAGEHHDPKVLVVAPMSGHHATLLRGTVIDLLPAHDVYITDWIDARDVPVERGRFDLDDYIDLVVEFLNVLGPNIHIIAVCQPAVPVIAAVSLMAAAGDATQPASMTLMGGPIDTRINPTEVDTLAETHSLQWFDQTLIQAVPFNHPGFGRRVYPGFLQLCGFMSMNLERHISAQWELFESAVVGDEQKADQKREFYDEFLSVMDMPAEFYLQTIRAVFQDHLLPRGLMTSRGRPVEPARIKRTALMTVEGERDDITGIGQCKAAHDLCTGLPDSMRRHHFQAKAGHYGIFNGHHWRQEVLPNVSEFIRAHDAVLAGQNPRRDDAAGVGIAV